MRSPTAWSAGRSANLSGAQAGAMGESWSDLMAIEYLSEYGFAPVGGENPFAVGAVRHGRQGGGHPQLRHEREPAQLLGRRLRLRVQRRHLSVLSQVHADGEIWSAANYDIRAAMNAALRQPATAALQRGVRARRASRSTACPGNRRWAQLVFDAWLLMAQGEGQHD